MVQINWTNQAVNDLRNIYDFIAADSDYYARRELSKIKLRTQNIKLFIKVGRVVPIRISEKLLKADTESYIE